MERSRLGKRRPRRFQCPARYSVTHTLAEWQGVEKAAVTPLRIAARQPSTDADVAALASGTADTFAVWTVAGRTGHELLMADRSGRTMSWLMVDADHLRFGSVVVPVAGRGGKLTLGPVFHSLLGAHKVYSRALLSGAARRLR